MQVSKVTFSFSEEAFRNYLTLVLLVRDARCGGPFILLPLVFGFPVLLIDFLAVYLSGFNLLTLFSSIRNGETDSFFLVLIPLTFLILCSIAYGAYILSVRKPKWSSPRWQARTELVFDRLHAGQTPAPINLSIIEKDGHYNPEKPRTLSMVSPITIVMPFIYFFVNTNFTPVYYDTIPWLYPRYPKPTGKLIKPVQFSAIFEEDRIIKGSHGDVFVNSYTEILDILEDKRIPNLAIIRTRNTLNELVVKTDELEGIQWEDLKAYIMQKKAEGSKLEVALRNFYDKL